LLPQNRLLFGNTTAKASTSNRDFVGCDQPSEVVAWQFASVVAAKFLGPPPRSTAA